MRNNKIYYALDRKGLSINSNLSFLFESDDLEDRPDSQEPEEEEQEDQENWLCIQR